MSNSHAQQTIFWLTVGILLIAVVAVVAASPEIYRLAIKFANLLHLLKHPVVA